MGSLPGHAVVVETSPAETGLSGSHGALGTPWGLLLLGHQYDEPQGPTQSLVPALRRLASWQKRRWDRGLPPRHGSCTVK